MMQLDLNMLFSKQQNHLMMSFSAHGWPCHEQLRTMLVACSWGWGLLSVAIGMLYYVNVWLVCLRARESNSFLKFSFPAAYVFPILLNINI